MNIPPGAPGYGYNQPNPQIQYATQLVQQVLSDMRSVRRRRSRRGTVSVSERRFRGWQSTLRTAVTTLQQIPVVMIYPPPPIKRTIDAAIGHINQALAILGSIPIASPQIYPPQPGRVFIPPQTLDQAIFHLQQAVGVLSRAY